MKEVKKTFLKRKKKIKILTTIYTVLQGTKIYIISREDKQYKKIKLAWQGCPCPKS